MKTILKRSLMLLLSVVLLLSLCACNSGVISTVMTVDENFAGSRVMSFDIKKSDLGGMFAGLLGAPTVDSIIDTLEENCPSEIRFTHEKDGNDAHCSFIIEFADFDEYKSKVTTLLGKNPTITYEGPSDNLFISGITLKENFSSVDLLKWASDVLAEKYPKYADDISISDQKGTTVVNFDGVEYTTESLISIEPTFTPFERVLVNTTRYGDSDYVRSVEIQVTPENLALIGKDRLTEQFLLPLTADITDISTAGWSEKTGSYTINMRQGNLEELSRFTSAIFDGSTVSYDADSNSGAFTESGVLNESVNFNGFVCREDGSANVTMTYTTTDETTFSDSGDGILSADKKTYTVVADGITSKDVKIISETRYIVESISVSTAVSLTGKTTVAILIDFPTQSSRSASELAAAYFEKEFADTGVTVSINTTGFSENSEAIVVNADSEEKPDSAPAAAAAQKYAVVFSVTGKPEEITEALSAAFGENNSFATEISGTFEIYKTSTVSHSIDLSALAELAQYGGNITYTYSGEMTKVQNVTWADTNGNSNKDVLGGQVRKETFSDSTIPCAPFVINYQYSYINVLLIGIVLIAGIAIICLLMLLSSKVSKRMQLKKRQKKQDMAIEAVKTVALATIPEEKRGELTELPKELTQRPMVVLEPRNDDGLDEDDDEPEGVQLFATTLRLLVVAVAVLFFFPFCNLQKSSLLDRAETISGWNLFMGKNIFGIDVDPQRFVIILLVIPVVILLLLMCRRQLPRLIIPLVVTAASLFSVFYLMQLPDTIAKTVEALKAGVTEYVTDPAYQMGYSYSIVIYVLLAIGGILLLFSDVSYILSQKRKENEK